MSSPVSRARRALWKPLLLTVIGLRLGSLTAPAEAQTADTDDDPFLAWLNALADAVVPPDQDPGAAQAGIGMVMRTVLAQKPDLRARYEEGRERLDAVARAAGAESFAAMTVEARGRLLLELLAEPTAYDSEAARFAALLRRDVLRLYYASPTGQAMVGYRPPLRGYPPPPGEAG